MEAKVNREKKMAEKVATRKRTKLLVSQSKTDAAFKELERKKLQIEAQLTA